MDFLSGYKTYIGIAALAIDAVLRALNVDVPPFVNVLLEIGGIGTATYGRVMAGRR